MKFKVPHGRYVVAVSGGVDSIVLLDLLSKLSGVELITAHFNHGIRKDSTTDEKLVASLAKKYQLPLELGHGHLGNKTSEKTARDARYKFLRKEQKKHKAKAIITAHHQDDLIETAILNLIRGSGRRGLTAISDNPDILRPMLNTPKADIVIYATAHHLKWVEDPSNKDESYLRNYIRLRILPKLSDEQRKKFLKNLGDMSPKNRVINQKIAKLSQNVVHKNRLNRKKFIQLPSKVAEEVMMHFLRSNGVRDFDRKVVGRLTVSAKTAKADTKVDVLRGATLNISTDEALLITDVNP